MNSSELSIKVSDATFAWVTKKPLSLNYLNKSPKSRWYWIAQSTAVSVKHDWVVLCGMPFYRNLLSVLVEERCTSQIRGRVHEFDWEYTIFPI